MKLAGSISAARALLLPTLLLQQAVPRGGVWLVSSQRKSVLSIATAFSPGNGIGAPLSSGKFHDTNHQRYHRCLFSSTRDDFHQQAHGQDDNAPFTLQQKLLAFDSFSKLAKQGKSWKRLGHLVDLALESPLFFNDEDTLNVSTSIADIGCDHGLLSIGLAISGRFHSVLGIDMSEQALKNGAMALLDTIRVENDKRSQQSNDLDFLPVQFRVGNGLEVAQHGEAEIVCIAGMGVHTMVKIVQQRDGGSGALHVDRVGTRQLVLQPTNSRPRHLILLYDTLQQQGWIPIDERIEYLSSRWYLTTSFLRKDDLVEMKMQGATDSDVPSQFLLPGCILQNLQEFHPMYPTFLRYVSHHIDWIHQDFNCAGSMAEEDKRWLAVFEAWSRRDRNQ
jgi:tRNA A22 N-methylase